MTSLVVVPFHYSYLSRRLVHQTRALLGKTQYVPRMWVLLGILTRVRPKRLVPSPKPFLVDLLRAIESICMDVIVIVWHLYVRIEY